MRLAMWNVRNVKNYKKLFKIFSKVLCDIIS